MSVSVLKSGVSRRALLKALGMAGGSLVLASCGSAAAPTATTAPKPVATTAPAAATTAPVAAAPTAAPTVAPTPVAKPANLTIKIMVDASSNPAPPRDQNSWWKELEKRLGVGLLDFDFVPPNNFNEKLAAVIAGGDMPDIIPIADWTPVILQAAAQGAFMPWDDLVDKSYKVKDPAKNKGFAALPERSWRNSAVNGKVWGMPAVRPAYGSTLWVRHDWVQKLGVGSLRSRDGVDPAVLKAIDRSHGGEMREPTTKDEMDAVWKAMLEKDPDGNAKKDTIPFVMSQPGTGTWGPQGMALFLQAYGVPHNYTEKADGSFVPSLLDPSFKEAVAWANAAYAAGYIDPDFQAINEKQRDQKMAEGKGGTYYYGISGYASRFRAILQTNEKARMWGITPISAAGKKGVCYNGSGWSRVTLISSKTAKDAAKRDKCLEILNFYTDPANDTFMQFGVEGTHFKRDANGIPTKLAEVGDFNSNMFDKLGNAPYDWYTATVDTTALNTGEMNALYKDLGQRLLKSGSDDPSWGLVSDIYRQKGKALDDFYNIGITNFVTGKTPLGDWDKFVAEWKSKGGDAITEDMSKLNIARKKG